MKKGGTTKKIENIKINRAIASYSNRIATEMLFLEDASYVWLKLVTAKDFDPNADSKLNLYSLCSIISDRLTPFVKGYRSCVKDGASSYALHALEVLTDLQALLRLSLAQIGNLNSPLVVSVGQLVFVQIEEARLVFESLSNISNEDVAEAA